LLNIKLAHEPLKEELRLYIDGELHATYSREQAYRDVLILSQVAEGLVEGIKLIEARRENIDLLRKAHELPAVENPIMSKEALEAKTATLFNSLMKKLGVKPIE
jgi:hypothetical protein